MSVPYLLLLFKRSIWVSAENYCQLIIPNGMISDFGLRIWFAIMKSLLQLTEYLEQTAERMELLWLAGTSDEVPARPKLATVKVAILAAIPTVKTGIINLISCTS